MNMQNQNNGMSGDKNNSSTDMITLVEKKIYFFEDIVQKTLIHVQHNKMICILASTDVNACVSQLMCISKKIKELRSVLAEANSDTLINNLQIINNELSSLFKSYGTQTLEDLLWICFGNNYVSTASPNVVLNEIDKSKLDLVKKYFHPTSYKVINHQTTQVKEEKKPRSTSVTKEDLQLFAQSANLDCYDISTSVELFFVKVHGLKLVIMNNALNKTLIISGYVDDIVLELVNNAFIRSRLQSAREHANVNLHKLECGEQSFERFLSSLSLKELLIHNQSDLFEKYAGMQSNIKSIKQKTISSAVKEFVSSDLFIKRNTIVQLLINADNYENQYLAYLLYDLLSNETNGSIDSQEQTDMFDSFNWNIKTQFREAMSNTIKYTNELTNFDVGKIPLEQQICLLKASEHVKEKAMQKLKEIKAKSEDTGSKARQYLDGLLKIPFNIYRTEPVLHIMRNLCSQFITMCANYVSCCPDNGLHIAQKDKYTSIELIAHTHRIKTEVQERFFQLDKVMAKISKKTKIHLLEVVISINEFILQHDIPIMPLLYTKKDKATLLTDIRNILQLIAETHKLQLCIFIMETVMGNEGLNAQEGAQPLKLVKDIVHMEDRFVQIQDYLTVVKEKLNDSIHGHEKAKQQIERIICQWINGEQDGHCFGFEGPPGVGKTSLAKYGLSSCLTDENGTSRPFAMIQMGGDSNGSSLHGHNYTYVGSNWGSIVQILMDKKCMNPIIFIDEVDKISKTEQGREIVGILTHLLDTTQNDCFQDKYFSGIDLDLSKALFILSYNDVDAIDKVLLDRIHRIKFYSLSIEEKLVICRKHILPDIYKKMGLEGVIQIEDDVMKYIIEEYTCEPGVRKLKEMLFDIVGEINKNILTNITNASAHQLVLPMAITKEQIKKVYLKDHQEIIYKTIHALPQVGTINGMYATGAGNGGIIPIQTSFMPGSKFLDLTLTGMQGQVMKESMNVALTLAWSLTDLSRQVELKSKYGTTNVQSIHIHCPEGATPKDGPSAGGAITCALFSLLNEKKIKNDVAMTGEISLNGDISAIGGLDVKIYGSIRAGVKTILYPKDNQKDFENFAEKYADAEIMVGIQFHSVRNIKEAIAIVMAPDGEDKQR